MHETSAYDQMIDQGIAIGEKKGAIQTLLKLGIQKFGQPDSATKEALTAIKDADRLDRFVDAFQTASSWQDWLGTP